MMRMFKKYAKLGSEGFMDIIKSILFIICVVFFGTAIGSMFLLEHLKRKK